MDPTGNPWWRRVVLMAMGVLLTLFFVASPVGAAAAAPQILWQTPSDGEAGVGAGRLDNPAGLATNPTSGSVYIADARNFRVSEFDAWGQFVKGWGWGVANGAAALQTCGPAATPPTVSCQRGLSGAGAGQFGVLRGGMAVGTGGNVYVGDIENHRVQVFDPAGHFLFMFGGKVNKTKVEEVGSTEAQQNLCTALSGDVCQAGTAGAGSGQFETAEFGTYVAAGPGGAIFVGDKGRIQKFNAAGAYQGEVDFSTVHAEEGAFPEEGSVQSLAVDTTGNFFLTFLQKDGVVKLSPAGGFLTRFPALWPNALAVDSVGNLYAAVQEHGMFRREVLEFDSSGAAIIPAGAGFAVQEGVVGGAEKGVGLWGLATNPVTAAGASDIYLSASSGLGTSFASAYGPAPDKWPPPSFPPEIKAQYATSVDADAAVVGAEINPRFWQDTRYYLEYGTGKCSEGGCVTHVPTPPGAELGAGIVGVAVGTKGILLAGLSPATTYHYRFVASSGGGGPTVGVGAGEAEATFTTPALGGEANPNCPSNQAFRSGPSARLPDCRAYEMVSPVDKNNTDIVSLINVQSNLATLDQSAVSGEKITYTTSQGFGDAQGVPYVSQYIASRGADGWQSHGITPTQGLSPVEIGQRADLEFRAFTADLCIAALQHSTDPALAPGAVEGFINLYRRRNCGEDGYEALTTSQPPTQTPANFRPEIQGLSADGRCAVFYAGDKLTPDASAGSNRQLYASCDGQMQLVSVLPNGQANTLDASVGTANLGSDFRNETDARAVSADGSRVYWTAAVAGPGKLYVRDNIGQEQSKVSGGKCTEATKACTITVSNAEAHFWSASPDGSKALFTIEGKGSGELYEFNFGNKKEPTHLIAAKVVGVLGAGEDASSVSFLSEEILSGANADGKSPSLGKPNLYFHEGSVFNFIGTLSSDDAHPSSSSYLSPVSPQPYVKTSRVSPDGRHLVFMSNASLTGYENIDANNGKVDAEVFTYNAEGPGHLYCVSCNPTGQRPSGRELMVEEQKTGAWAAALLPAYATELYGSRAISDDGNRVFFDAYEALVGGDTNGKADVYQWEAPGSGDCEVGGPAYRAPNGGCLSLISSGESSSDSEFVDASADGRDVFFTTSASLLPQDPGLIDIYDARLGGGYPPPPSQPPSCEGEACQSPPAPPDDPTPASSIFEGAGNVRKGGNSRCGKGKIYRGGHCVPKHKHRHAHKSRSKRAHHSQQGVGR